MTLAPLSGALPLPRLFSVASRRVPARPRIEPGDRDGELVLRARRGDRWAEEALYNRHVRAVTRVALRLLGRVHEAEDVVQDAFVVAFTDLPKLRYPDAFGSWLLTIAVRQVRRRFRRRRVLRALGLDRQVDDVTLAEQADPAAGPDVAVALRQVDRMLEAVAPGVRVAWILRRVEGEELEAVAALAGCSLATAKRWIARADRLLEERLHAPPRGGGPR